MERIHDGLAQTSWPRQSGPRCDILARPKRQFGPMIRPFGPKNRRFGPNIFCITNPAIDGTQSWLQQQKEQGLGEPFCNQFLDFKIFCDQILVQIKHSEMLKSERPKSGRLSLRISNKNCSLKSGFLEVSYTILNIFLLY